MHQRPFGRFFVGKVYAFKRDHTVKPCSHDTVQSSPWWYTCRLYPAELPRQQHADEEDNGQADSKSQSGGHVALFGGLTLNGWGAAPHHVHQGRTQTEQNGNKRDGDKKFHGPIIQ